VPLDEDRSSSARASVEMISHAICTSGNPVQDPAGQGR
jgi:hypothetical protein